MNGTLSLTDAGGHTSNALAFNTTIPERRRGAVGENRAPASVTGVSARLGR